MIADIVLPRALDGSSSLALCAALKQAADDPNYRVIVLRGEAGCFCEGLDLNSLMTGNDGMRAAVDAFAQTLALLKESSKPTLALVDGAVRGGGMGVAAACDVVIATERSTFALPEALWGLLPAMIYPALRQRMSLQKCRLWSLLGAAQPSAAALAAGLVDQVVPDGELERVARKWTRQLFRVQRDTVIALRALVNEDVTAHPAGLRKGTAITAAALESGRLSEAFLAFAQGGPAPWERKE